MLKDYNFIYLSKAIGDVSSLHSTTSFASPKTKSLRATVPEGIVAFLGLQAGDQLDWLMHVVEGERVVIVSKVVK